MVVFYNDITEALNNFKYKKEDRREIDKETPEAHWLFVYYKDRVYYDMASQNPKENEELKKIMLKNIKHQILKH